MTFKTTACRAVLDRDTKGAPMPDADLERRRREADRVQRQHFEARLRNGLNAVGRVLDGLWGYTPEPDEAPRKAA